MTRATISLIGQAIVLFGALGAIIALGAMAEALCN